MRSTNFLKTNFALKKANSWAVVTIWGVNAIIFIFLLGLMIANLPLLFPPSQPLSQSFTPTLQPSSPPAAILTSTPTLSDFVFPTLANQSTLLPKPTLEFSSQITLDATLPSPTLALPLPTSTYSPSPSSTATFTPTITQTATPVPFSEGPFPVGYSVQSRPIEAYRFGTGPIKRVIISGIHGGYESNTVALAKELIDYLNKHPELLPSDITLFIIPSINPDGIARSTGPEGRSNANKVDINRNWDAFWQAEWPRSGCFNLVPLTAGAHPASEPETYYVASFLLNNQVDALISYHSAALGIFPGGQPPDQHSIDLAKALKKVSTYAYPPKDYGCKYTGQLIDWASIHGIAAVDIELTNHKDTDFAINLKILKVFLSWKRSNP